MNSLGIGNNWGSLNIDGSWISNGVHDGYKTSSLHDVKLKSQYQATLAYVDGKEYSALNNPAIYVMPSGKSAPTMTDLWQALQDQVKSEFQCNESLYYA